jgi:hypothetical protein
MPWWMWTLVGVVVVGIGVLGYFKRPRRDSLPWASDSERRQYKNRPGEYTPPDGGAGMIG